MTTTIHPDVLAKGHDFRVIGMSTPTTVARKADLLLYPNKPGEQVAVVVGDPLRCSTTILASLAAGSKAVTITVKGGTRGTRREDAACLGEHLGLELVLGGELHGKPIPDGVIGNSPRAATSALLDGKLLHFQSTNFGAAFTEVAERVGAFRMAGGVADIYVVAFANVAALAQAVRARHYDRLFVATGGFYDVISFEDMLVAGELLERVGICLADADDEARAMLACARAVRSSAARVEALRSNWIGRCLALFGVDPDIEAAILGRNMDPTIYRRMQRLVPVVNWLAGIPVIVPMPVSNSRGKSISADNRLIARSGGRT